MLDPKGRVALVTGANRGIGRAIAEALFARGWSLSLGLRDPGKAGAMIAGWDPARLHVAHFDARERATHAAWVEAAHARFGRIDGLVNNAGVVHPITLRDDDEAALDDVWLVNCKAPLNLIRLALPHLEATGTGRVINIASLSGKRVKNDHVAYAMSKFAVVALTHATRRIGWDRGVRATVVCPSFVATDMTADVTKVARAEMTAPADLAELVATVMGLPNNAVVAELLVNCRLEEFV